MPSLVNVNGIWKSVSNIYANVNGTWRKIQNGYANVNGTWRQIYSAVTFTLGGTSPTPGEIDLSWSTVSGANSYVLYINGVAQTYTLLTSSIQTGLSTTANTAFLVKAYTSTNGTGSPIAQSNTFNYIANGYDATQSITPNSQTLIGTVGTALSSYSFTVNGLYGTISYSISPALSTGGLSFSTSTGKVTGTPTAALSSTTYTITATGSTHGSATYSLTLSVSSYALSPSSQTISGTTYHAITNSSSFTGVGFTPNSFSVSPSLPSGLSIDSSTGIISGTPTATQSATSYTITGSNGSASATSTVSITVTLGTPVNYGAPTIAQSSTTPSTASVTSNGSWYNSPTSYTYSWSYQSISGYVGFGTNNSSATLSGNYGSNIVCNITASNSVGAGDTSASNIIVAIGPPIFTYSRGSGGSSSPYTPTSQGYISINKNGADHITYRIYRGSNGGGTTGAGSNINYTTPYAGPTDSTTSITYNIPANGYYDMDAYTRDSAGTSYWYDLGTLGNYQTGDNLVNQNWFWGPVPTASPPSPPPPPPSTTPPPPPPSTTPPPPPSTCTPVCYTNIDTSCASGMATLCILADCSGTYNCA